VTTITSCEISSCEYNRSDDDMPIFVILITECIEMQNVIEANGGMKNVCKKVTKNTSNRPNKLLQ